MEDGRYNLLAQVLSDEPHIDIQFAIFKGKTKASTMYAVRNFGQMCLLLSLDKVLDFGDTMNIPQADERNRKVERKEVMLFDAEAYREAVINAFVHNAWADGHSPMFTAYEDRIEITSMGTLPPKQTKAGFFAGKSVPVNENLAEIFLQLHISEKSGRGVPRIVEAYGEEAFDIESNTITVTIPFNKLDVDCEQEKKHTSDQVSGQDSDQVGDQDSDQVVSQTRLKMIEDIIAFCEEPKTRAEIQEYVGIASRRYFRMNILNPLIEKGRIHRTIPDKPNSKYQKYISIKP